MITLLCFVTLVGFEFWYYSSKRAQFDRILLVSRWPERYPKSSRWIGTGILVISLGGFIMLFGLGSGSFYFLASLMLVSGMTVVLSPINYFQPLGLGLVLLFFLLLELA